MQATRLRCHENLSISLSDYPQSSVLYFDGAANDAIRLDNGSAVPASGLAISRRDNSQNSALVCVSMP